jgi:hypothetical protein
MPQEASAIPLSFNQITYNGSINVASQLSVNVTDNGNGTVSFTFSNNGPLSCAITDIYFADGGFVNGQLTAGAGVDYSFGAAPGALPSAPASFAATIMIVADSNSPTNANGIQPGEFLAVTFGYGSYGNFATVLSLLSNPGPNGIQIGVHVQGIGQQGQSNSFIATPLVSVPEGGATVALLGSALTALGAARRYFKTA